MGKPWSLMHGCCKTYATAAWPVFISHPAEDRQLSWPEWLATYQDGIHMKVTHVSTNRAWCAVTSLVWPMMLPAGRTVTSGDLCGLQGVMRPWFICWFLFYISFACLHCLLPHLTFFLHFFPWLERTSPKWPILCRMGCKTLINHGQPCKQIRLENDR